MCQLLLGCGGAVTATAIDAGTPEDAAASTSSTTGDAGAARAQDAAVPIDAGGANVDATADAGMCVTVDTTGFDASCRIDNDCIAVNVGTACTQAPGCMCGAGTINSSDDARFQDYANALISSLPPPPAEGGGLPCMCPSFGRPYCIRGQCTLCGGAAPANPGCFDGG